MATDRPTQLGMVGLGRMGANLVERRVRDGHSCVVYDVNVAAVEKLKATTFRYPQSLVAELLAESRKKRQK